MRRSRICCNVVKGRLMSYMADLEHLERAPCTTSIASGSQMETELGPSVDLALATPSAPSSQCLGRTDAHNRSILFVEIVKPSVLI